MRVKFHKYHAVGNDFVIIDSTVGISSRRLSNLALAICDRRTGVGADGMLTVAASDRADRKLDVYNADGGWAEKSGNGLRIAAVHLRSRFPKRKAITLETGSSVDQVTFGRQIKGGCLATTELGEPVFEARQVPVKTKAQFVINMPLSIGEVELPMTCVAVGNPHAVLVVDDFDFDWRMLGEEIEHAAVFPNRTNVEFVKPVNRKKLRLCEWERGAGATGSSGTGAAAAVCAMVMLGLVERECRVEFEAGGLDVLWNEKNNIIKLTGPVEYVSQGEFEFQ